MASKYIELENNNDDDDDDAVARRICNLHDRAWRIILLTKILRAR